MISFGQNAKEKGNLAFEKFKYQEAIELYKEWLSSNKNDNATSVLLAETYFLTGQYVEAEQVLSPLESYIYERGDIMLKYARILMLNDKKTKSQEILKKYIQKYYSNAEYKRIFESLSIKTDTGSSKEKFILTPATFASEVSEYCPAFYDDKIFFTSQRGGKKDAWTGRSFSNIFSASENGKDVNPIKGNLNGKFHNGALCFIDENNMIFTRNNSKKGKNNEYNLILAFATRSGDEWKFKEEFAYNNIEYSNAYPTYFPNEKMMIFSSDKPNGKGGMDLYFSKFDGKNWTMPSLLAGPINTSGDEVFPTNDGKNLYFSSNGMTGLGGFDLYKTIISNFASNKIEHLPSPLNTSRDDFGLITKDDMNSGYLSTNQGGNGSIDKILYFKKEIIVEAPKDMLVTGIVLDEYTKIPLKETVVAIKDVEGNIIKEVTTDETGRFSFNVQSNAAYVIQGEKNGIKTTKENTEKLVNGQSYYYTLLHNDPRFSLEGYSLNVKTKKGVENVNISCFNSSQNKGDKMATNSEGFFKFQLEQNSNFEISGNKDGYYTSVSNASTVGLNRSTTLYVKLYLNVEEVILGETKILGKESIGNFNFDPVLYDLDKSEIRPDAARALDKVVDFMNKNGKLIVELGSHTDSRSSDSYNLALSDRRAKAAVDYIIKHGIDANRITSKGYGETQHVNRCSNGTKCSEEEHQANRRTEIKIIGNSTN